MLHVGCSLKLGNGAVLGVKDAFGKCKGLNIASVAKTTSYDVMKDGSIIHPWDGVPQANLATADEYDRQFYITKDGVPLYFNNVTVHHANPYMKHKGYVIKPTLQNDEMQSIATNILTKLHPSIYAYFLMVMEKRVIWNANPWATEGKSVKGVHPSILGSFPLELVGKNSVPGLFTA
eukprot:Stramenopile-MAST_4_protein_4150